MDFSHNHPMVRNGVFALAAVALTVLAGSFLAGCQSSDNVGGVYRTGGNPKVVSLSPSTTEILGKVGNYQAIVGRTANCNWPSTVSRATVVVKGTAPDYELIAGMKPDFAVYDGALYTDAQITKLKDLGMKMINWDPQNFEQYERASFELSNLLGGETNVSEYLDSILRNIAEAKGSLEEKKLVNPRLALLIGKPGNYLAPGKESLWGSLVTEIGGVLIGPASNRFGSISTEELVKQNPQVILTGSDGLAILSDPALKSVEAIKSKRVFEVDKDVLLRRGGRLDQLVEAMGTALNKVKS